MEWRGEQQRVCRVFVPSAGALRLISFWAGCWMWAASGECGGWRNGQSAKHKPSMVRPIHGLSELQWERRSRAIQNGCTLTYCPALR